ncbi:uncharacterized protein EV420DRAFT_1747831 [Desarmillaria tabescens]|uniref:Uncharacterized protein n=1 Tax=Armillaria tabescens TaxID=1929756 RepID=A0AA39N6A3_ARMTA|nr:uncharacterized protein EV420DRAFT_1747831 [Desarmillaria tabescens]KAK0458885.1 hypothetical protein EV420DRAFT_1747831 [Desarmillaria tabescens]
MPQASPARRPLLMGNKLCGTAYTVMRRYRGQNQMKIVYRRTMDSADVVAKSRYDRVLGTLTSRCAATVLETISRPINVDESSSLQRNNFGRKSRFASSKILKRNVSDILFAVGSPNYSQTEASSRIHRNEFNTGCARRVAQAIRLRNQILHQALLCIWRMPQNPCKHTVVKFPLYKRRVLVRGEENIDLEEIRRRCTEGTGGLWLGGNDQTVLKGGACLMGNLFATVVAEPYRKLDLLFQWKGKILTLEQSDFAIVFCARKWTVPSNLCFDVPGFYRCGVCSEVDVYRKLQSISATTLRDSSVLRTVIYRKKSGFVVTRDSIISTGSFIMPYSFVRNVMVLKDGPVKWFDFEHSLVDHRAREGLSEGQLASAVQSLEPGGLVI